MPYLPPPSPQLPYLERTVRTCCGMNKQIILKTKKLQGESPCKVSNPTEKCTRPVNKCIFNIN